MRIIRVLGVGSEFFGYMRETEKLDWRYGLWIIVVAEVYIFIFKFFFSHFIYI